ncbi:MAG: rhodanese-like domain-containing protein [Acidimicrobiia bacterium]
MFFAQYYLDCLSQASYLIADESTGRAVVVDPRRDVGEYLDEAAARGFTIELVIETHFHADFLSGHLELARATGAEIGYGEAAEADFDFRRLRDGERISLGDVTLEILATPGHTPESISVVVYEHAADAVPYGVLTGDSLFIGDVGRPDLLASKGVTPDELARCLYDSVHTKLLTLPDATRVFPGHGAGSACGKSLSTETQSTIGEQRRTNYALAPMSADDFVAAVTEGQSMPPGYFSYDAGLNRSRHDLLDEAEVPAPLDLDAVLKAQAEGAVVLDTRDAAVFAAGHLVGSLNVGFEGRFAEYVGAVVDPGAAIVLVSESGTERDAKVRLARIGYDRVTGHLDDPVAALGSRPEATERSSRVTAVDLGARLAAGEATTVVDVRNAAETALGTIPGALTIPLNELRGRLGEIPAATATVVYCAGGYRSSAAASVLGRAGLADVSDLIGGYTAWAMADPALKA